MKRAVATVVVFCLLLALMLFVIAVMGHEVATLVLDCIRAEGTSMLCPVAAFGARYWWMLVLPAMLVLLVVARLIASRWWSA